MFLVLHIQVRFSGTVIDPATTWHVSDQIFYIHSLLANPENPNIPEFLEPIYYSHSGIDGIVVYKIDMGENNLKKS
jgi:hypothetical protein